MASSASSAAGAAAAQEEAAAPLALAALPEQLLLHMLLEGGCTARDAARVEATCRALRDAGASRRSSAGAQEAGGRAGRLRHRVLM